MLVCAWSSLAGKDEFIVDIKTKLIYKTGGISCNKRCITNEETFISEPMLQIRRIQELVNKRFSRISWGGDRSGWKLKCNCK